MSRTRRDRSATDPSADEVLAVVAFLDEMARRQLHARAEELRSLAPAKRKIGRPPKPKPVRLWEFGYELKSGKRGRPDEFTPFHRKLLLRGVEIIREELRLARKKGADTIALVEWIRQKDPWHAEREKRVPPDVFKRYQNQLARARKEAGRPTRNAPNKGSFKS